VVTVVLAVKRPTVGVWGQSVQILLGHHAGHGFLKIVVLQTLTLVGVVGRSVPLDQEDHANLTHIMKTSVIVLGLGLTAAAALKKIAIFIAYQTLSHAPGP
jgi:hypothetical protein